MKRNSWFSVDKEGLRKLIDERGKSFAVFELVQNEVALVNGGQDS